MNKKIRVIGLLICAMMFTVGLVTNTVAQEEVEEESYGDSEAVIVLNFWMDEDGGFIYIGDEDVIGDMQLDINQLSKEIISLNKRINNAQDSADAAYYYSQNAIVQALENKNELVKQNDTLVLQYNQLTDTVEKLWILRDEVVAFEGHYFDYVNETDSTLAKHDLGISNTQKAASENEKDIEDLNKKLKATNNTLWFIIFLIGAGFLTTIAYIVIKRYKSKKIYSVKRNKQPSLAAFAPTVKKSKKPSILHARIRVRKIRVKKSKTTTHKPLRIKRNPERSPVRFFLTLFHKL